MTDIQTHLSWPENRIRYCLAVMAWEDQESAADLKAFPKFLEWVGKAQDDFESHY